jgi:hypothetical protein
MSDAVATVRETAMSGKGKWTPPRFLRFYRSGVGG